jgi:mono/diheme cytochrome c family protein
MKLRIAFLTLAAIWTVSFALPAARAEQAAPAAGASKTVWDGVFTDEQATRGELAYKDNCGSCHGGDLGGDGFAPALAGAEFAGNWNDLSVGDFYERIRISMPPTGPSTVTNAQKADIVAHIFKINQYPVGKEELPPNLEVLKAIKIEMKK